MFAGYCRRCGCPTALGERVSAAALAHHDQLPARWVRPGARLLVVGTATGERTLATVPEYVRVNKPDGVVVHAVRSLPVRPVGYVLDAVRQHLARKHDPLMHLLADREQPFHRCKRSSIRRCAGGLTTVATVSKCCPITQAHLPCRN